VALVGRNGEGKTTFVRVVTGELEPFSGQFRLGHNVNTGYYAQNQEDILDKNDTVYETLDKIAVGDIRTKLRDILGAFLFRGEDIDKKVAVLSGGERARLAMAKLMLHPYNLLALDEPTNHMDIRSKDILKSALQKYNGTLLIVSHDRDFLDGLVDKVYEFRDGRVKEHLGGISEFLEKMKMENLHELERSIPEIGEKKASRKETESKGGAARIQNVRRAEDRRLKNKIASLEKDISRLEQEVAEIEQRLAAPDEGDDIMSMTQKYLDLTNELNRAMDLWASMEDETNKNL